MEVILSRGSPNDWNCKVSLRIEHSEVPEQALGVFEFGKTRSKDEVTNLLQRAQLATLNPSTSLAKFATLAETELNEYRREKNFSRNTVILEINGAEVDVTFLDLPGIIQNTEKVERRPIRLIN